ncbi:MAG TPA: PIG-L family deacetylase [Candidatus Limnocylindrales bacterium]|nr:PIG-L family deacetylase [Candidatus Limnocylindrales bacterium]
MPSAHRLLIAYAHPDDESFGLGAMIAAYVARGVEVTLICATNGECGAVKPEFMEGFNSIKELRLAELDKAVKVLGLQRLVLLDYTDSGMMGSETANDPECLWQAPQEAVTRRVVEVLRDVRPQVVVTFNRYGGYGHPDHIAIQRAATDAFFLASDASYDTGQPPYSPQKLYYSGINQLTIRAGIWLTRLRGQDPRRLGRNKDIDIVKILDNIDPIHATVEISHFLDIGDAASACHASQLGGGFVRIPKSVRRRVQRRQGFTRVFPKPEADRIDERDLFVGVQPDALVSAAAD